MHLVGEPAHFAKQSDSMGGVPKAASRRLVPAMCVFGGLIVCYGPRTECPHPTEGGIAFRSIQSPVVLRCLTTFYRLLAAN